MTTMAPPPRQTAHHGLVRLGPPELGQLRPELTLASFGESKARRCFLARPVPPGEALYFVCSETVGLAAQQWFEPLIERLAPRSLVRAVASEADVDDFLATAESQLSAIAALGTDSTASGSGPVADGLQLSMAAIEATRSPVVKLVDSTLYDALKIGASDVHLEVQHKTLRIKYRLDGVLQPVREVESLETAQQVISRIKVLANLDISERRIPQDGRFRVVFDQREVDFRVSVMPNATDEDAVLRILDRKHLVGQFHSLTLDSLGLDSDTKAFVRKCSRLPYGLLLATGPTGSGKTTTLYAALSEINSGLDKIVTIEDPIEYQLPGVLQIPVNEKKGLTFAKGLRSILRHDPDKIMVGEIRDSETAHIAVQAALTGHQVFTTVHANNVFDVIGRLSNMGVDSYTLVAALSGVMAQRLVRKLCPKCAARQGASMKPVGCEACRGTGYKGRVAIAETLALGDDIKDLLVQNAPVSALKKLARDQGFRSLRESAEALVTQGITSTEEVERVAPAE